jgi:glycosyltransferase involved in cell wall biosynthesis
MKNKKKKRLIFDIAYLSSAREIAGIPRFTIEVLRRLIKRDIFDITLICSGNREEDALRNCYHLLGQKKIPFQSKDIENYVLPLFSTSKKQPITLFGRIEMLVYKIIPYWNWLDTIIEKARIIKRKIIPPYPVTIASSLKHQELLLTCQRSPLWECLVLDSDAYFSPYFAIIPEIDVNPSINKIRVVHDLIPILFPHLYPQYSNFLKEVGFHNITSDVRVLTDSLCTKIDLLHHFPHITENQVTIIPLGSDERFCHCEDNIKIKSVLKKYGLSKNTVYILSVGTLEIRKNFDHVIHSFVAFIEKYGDQFPNVQLVLTGRNDWLDKKIYKAYKALKRKVREKIIFTGYVDDADLPLLYAGAACFCYMSFYEGFGLPPLEAMQSGTPVITSNTSSLPEVVGDAGILLDPNDVDGLVEAFYRVLTDENLRNEMIQKGLEQAKKFSWDQCVDLIIEKINN